MKPETPIEIGRIAGPHGLGGEVHYRPHDETSTLPRQGMTVRVGRPGGTWRSLVVRGRRPEAKGALLSFAGVEDRTAAERLRGLSVEVTRADLPETAPGEFYFHDVIGVEARDAEGRAFGRVEEIFHAGSDVLVIRGPGGEWMVPVVEGMVLEIGPDGVVVDREALEVT